SGADYAERCLSRPDCGFIGSKEPYELSGNGKTDNCAGNHDHAAHGQSDKIYFPDPFIFSRAVIIADHRTHSLNDSAGGKIQKGLQLIVDSQDDYIALGECGQKAVQHRDEKGGQGQIKNCGNSDGVQTQIDPFVRIQIFSADTHTERPGFINNKVDGKIYHLPDSCGKSGA